MTPAKNTQAKQPQDNFTEDVDLTAGGMVSARGKPPATVAGAGLKTNLQTRQETKPWLATNLSKLKSENVDVKVFDSAVIDVKDGMFSSTSHLFYSIALPSETDYSVRRKDVDFDAVHSYLTKAYPNVIIPPCKKYNVAKKNMTRYRDRRGRFLSRFIRNALRNRLLRGDKYLMTFLMQKDNKVYADEMKFMHLFKKVESIRDIITDEGFVEMSETEVVEIQKSGVTKIMENAFSTSRIQIRLHE